MRLTLVFAIALAACSAQPQPEQLGVEIFAEDTIPVRFTVAPTGTLQMRVNAERSYVQPDKSMVFETPATLLVYKGVGTSIVAALDGAQRLAVQPVGVSADSAERMAVVGAAVRITRTENASRLRLEVASP